jgi:hypothetical protein
MSLSLFVVRRRLMNTNTKDIYIYFGASVRPYVRLIALNFLLEWKDLTELE